MYDEFDEEDEDDYQSNTVEENLSRIERAIKKSKAKPLSYREQCSLLAMQSLILVPVDPHHKKPTIEVCADRCWELADAMDAARRRRLE